MVEILKCPLCGEELEKLGAKCECFGEYDNRDGDYEIGEFILKEIGATIEYYCPECGGTLPEEIADKYFKEGETK